MSDIKSQPIQELPPESLRRVCDPSSFAFDITDDLPFEPGIIGQDRAVEAIRFGLDITSPGFNVFVMGPTGSGRRSILKRIVEEKAQGEAVPDDWVYVMSFAEPTVPHAIRLPPGRGRQFRGSMERFSAALPDRLQLAFDTDRYASAREEMEQQYRALEREALASVEAACRERNCVLVRSPAGLYIAALGEGDLLSPEAVSQLDPDERARIQHNLDYLDDLLDDSIVRWRISL